MSTMIPPRLQGWNIMKSLDIKVLYVYYRLICKTESQIKNNIHEGEFSIYEQ